MVSSSSSSAISLSSMSSVDTDDKLSQKSQHSDLSAEFPTLKNIFTPRAPVNKLPVIQLSQDEKPKKKKPAVKKSGNLPAKRGRPKKEKVFVEKVKKVTPKKARKKKEKKQSLSQPITVEQPGSESDTCIIKT